MGELRESFPTMQAGRREGEDGSFAIIQVGGIVVVHYRLVLPGFIFHRLTLTVFQSATSGGLLRL